MTLDEIVKINEIESVNLKLKQRLDRTNIKGWLKICYRIFQFA